MSPEERFELIDHLARCQVLLGMLQDPEAKRIVADLIAFIEARLAAMHARLVC